MGTEAATIPVPRGAGMRRTNTLPHLPVTYVSYRDKELTVNTVKMELTALSLSLPPLSLKDKEYSVFERKVNVPCKGQCAFLRSCSPSIPDARG